MKRIGFLLTLAAITLLCCNAFAGTISTNEALYDALTTGSFDAETTLVPGRVYDLSLVEGWAAKGFSKTIDGKGAVIVLPEDTPLFGTNVGTIKNIRIKLAKNITSANTLGAVCCVNDGTVSGCTVFSENGSKIYTTTNDHVGAVAGYNYGTITDCQILNLTVGNSTQPCRAGGITGTSTGKIYRCRIKSVSITADGSSGYAGGITAANLYGGTIYSCEIVKACIHSGYAAGIAAINSLNRTDTSHSPIINSSYINSSEFVGKYAAAFTVDNQSGYIRFSHAVDNYIVGTTAGAGVTVYNRKYSSGGKEYGSPYINAVYYDTRRAYTNAVYSGLDPHLAEGWETSNFTTDECIEEMGGEYIFEMGDKYPVFIGEQYIKVVQPEGLLIGSAAAVNPDGVVLHDDTWYFKEDYDSFRMAFSVTNGEYSYDMKKAILHGRESFTVKGWYAEGDIYTDTNTINTDEYLHEIECGCYELINNNQARLTEAIFNHYTNFSALTKSLYPAAIYTKYENTINTAAANNSINTTFALADTHIKNMNRNAIYRPEGVALDISETVIGKGKTKQLTAEITPDYADCQIIIWSSSDSSVASVSNDGLITGVKEGTAEITAETAEGGYKAKCKVTVKEHITAEGIALNRTKILYLKEGKTYTFIPTITPEDAENKSVKWGMGNEALCSLYKTSDTKAIVYGKSQGRTQIGVRSLADEKLLAKCGIQVYKPITKAEISAATLTLSVGQTKTLSAKITPKDATYKDKIKWGSTKSKIASVDANGKITAKSKGTCIIGFKTSEGGLKATCKVTVK